MERKAVMADDDNKPADGGDNGDDGNDNKPAGSGDSGDVARMREALRKANAEAKKSREELAALKANLTEGKSDAERMAAKVAELEERTNKADERAMRAEVAHRKDLTPDQARRILGTTIEEMEADADDLLAAFKPADGDGAVDDGARKPAATRPRENLRPGATPPADAGEKFDPGKTIASIPF